MNKVDGERSSVALNSSASVNVDNGKLIDLSDYWRTIKQAKWVIIFITLCGVLIGGFIASSASPVYKSSVKILAEPQQPNADKSEQYVASTLVFLFFETQYEIIKSRNIAETVVDNLDLVEKYKKTLLQTKKENAGTLKSTINNIKTEISETLFNDTNKKPSPLSDSELKIMLASKISEEIVVAAGKKSKIINISYTSTDPQEATDVINAVSDVYIQYSLATRLNEVKSTESWLGDQFLQLEEKLRDSEMRLSEYRIQQGLVDTNQQQNIVNTKLQSLNNELIRAQTTLSAAEEQYLAVKDVQTGSKDFYSLGPVQQNKTASEMVKVEADLLQRVNELSGRYGEKHPKMISARSELTSAQSNLEREVSKVIDNIEKNYRLAQYQVANISKLLDKTQSNIQAIQSENYTLVSLEREVENNRRIYENFQLSLVETNGQSEYTASNINIIDRATLPTKPFKPNVKLIIAVAGVFGLFLGVTLAFVRAALDNTFKSVSMVEENLNIVTLGVIPAVKKSKRLGTPETRYMNDSMTPFAESINNIRTGLLFSNFDNPPQTILVTSSTSGEGKSTTAINLAVAFSHIGSTLLLELDLRKPSINKSLEIDALFGITDLIAGVATTLNDIIYKSEDEELSVITCGSTATNPYQLLSSEKFEKILVYLKSRFKYIIIDSPPTLLVSDSCVLANKVDGVILVVKADDTKVRDAKEALSRLQKINAKLVGTVLTAVEPQKLKQDDKQYFTNNLYGTKPVGT